MVNFKLSRGPNSLMGVASAPKEEEGSYVSTRVLGSRHHKSAEAHPLRVHCSEKLARDTGASLPRGVAWLHPDHPLVSNKGHAQITLEGGADCVLRASVSPAVPSTDAIALADEDRYNCHVAEDQTANFVRFVPPADERHDLVDVEIEVRVMRVVDVAETRASSSDEDEEDEEGGKVSSPSEGGRSPERISAEVDGASLLPALRKRLENRWVYVGEVVTLSYPRDGDDLEFLSGTSLRLRVARCDTIDATDAAVALGYHCYRGCVVNDTRVLLHAVDDVGCDEGGTCVTVGGGLRLMNSTVRGGEAAAKKAAARELVSVHTSDGETFPVHRRLLRPCIALTRAIREAGADGPAVSSGKRREWEASAGIEDSGSDRIKEDRRQAECDVDVDCATFDRVLVWLEAEALGRVPPEHDIRIVEELAEAADALGLTTLTDYCSERLGEHESRRRVRSWREVFEHNERGGCWIVIDGMVLDVKRWLPEHPGGDRIIPAQSMNVECARHFELYHSSRESFLYLKHFYVGEVRAEDRSSVPTLPGPPASDDFLQQLREFTDDFRVSNEVAPEDETHVHVHLGAR